MKGVAPSPTKADKLRFEQLHGLGCIACWIRCRAYRVPEIHHISQRSNSMTIPLCDWHHRSVPPDGMTVSGAEVFLGPSLALNKRAFERDVGTEEELLEFVNDMLRHNAVMVA